MTSPTPRRQRTCDDPRSRDPRPGRPHHRARAAVGTLAAIMTVGVASLASADNEPSVKGTLSHEGTTTRLDHVTLGTLYRGTVVVLVTDIELGPPCEALDASAVAEERPFTGFFVTVDQKTLQLYEDGLNMLFHPSFPSKKELSVIEDGLSLAQASPGWARGKLEGSYTVDEQKFDISVELSIPLEVEDAPPAPRHVSGADSKPAKAFAALVQAVMAADLEKVKALTAEQTHEQIEQVDPAQAKEMLADFADFLIPEEIEITGTEGAGDEVTLIARGRTRACLGTEESDGRIEMRREGGAWKTAAVSFEG